MPAEPKRRSKKQRRDKAEASTTTTTEPGEAFATTTLEYVTETPTVALQPSKNCVALETLSTKRQCLDRPCWGCAARFGSPVDPREYPDRFNLWRMYNDLRSTTSEWHAWEQVAKFHREIILPKMQAYQPESALEWPVDMVKLHCTEHMHDPTTKLYQQLRAYETLLRETQDTCMYLDDDGKMRVDHEAVESLNKLQATYQRLLKSRPEQFFGFQKQGLGSAE